MEVNGKPAMPAGATVGLVMEEKVGESLTVTCRECGGRQVLVRERRADGVKTWHGYVPFWREYYKSCFGPKMADLRARAAVGELAGDEL